MEDEPLVSIILPTYNRSKFLYRAVESVIKQTFKNWELIIVDDASTDDTQALFKDIALQDRRIQYHRLEKNGGACIARNKGIQVSKGEYITFLDSDDEYFPKKLELQVYCFKTSEIPNLGVVSCGREDVKDGVKYREWVPSFKGNILKNLLQKSIVGAGPPFLMIKKRVFSQNKLFFDPEMPSGEEWDLMVRICQNFNFDYVPQPLVRVHHHSGERVYTNERALIAIEKQYAKYNHLLQKDSKIHDKYVLKMVVQNFLYGHPDIAISKIKNQIKYKNLLVKIWLIYIRAFQKRESFASKAIFKMLNSLSFQ